MSFMFLKSPWVSLYWEKSRFNLLRLQRRILKSTLVRDFKKCFQVQKLLVVSNSARLLSIRLVSFKNMNKFKMNMHFSSAKSTINFIEKFHLNQFLFLYCFNWKPKKYVDSLFSVSDIAWNYLLKFAAEPAQEPLFSPRNFGFRSSFSVFMLQKIIFLNLDKMSNGSQKRVFLLEIKGPFETNKFNFFFRKLIVPKCFKLSLFKFFNFGLKLDFLDKVFSLHSFSSFLSNVLFHGFEKKFDSIRFGSHFLFFLSPKINELLLFNYFSYFLIYFGLKFCYITFNLFSTLMGFNFLGWYFKFYLKQGLLCIPSF